jgi:hypothetical protein
MAARARQPWTDRRLPFTHVAHSHPKSGETRPICACKIAARYMPQPVCLIIVSREIMMASKRNMIIGVTLLVIVAATYYALTAYKWW